MKLPINNLNMIEKMDLRKQKVNYKPYLKQIDLISSKIQSTKKIMQEIPEKIKNLTVLNDRFLKNNRDEENLNIILIARENMQFILDINKIVQIIEIIKNEEESESNSYSEIENFDEEMYEFLKNPAVFPLNGKYEVNMEYFFYFSGLLNIFNSYGSQELLDSINFIENCLNLYIKDFFSKAENFLTVLTDKKKSDIAFQLIEKSYLVDSVFDFYMEKNNIHIGEIPYGIYFNLTGIYYFFPADEDINILIDDIPKVIRFHKKLNLKRGLKNTFKMIIDEKLSTAPLPEILSLLKNINSLYIPKNMKIGIYDQIDQYLLNLSRRIDPNDILALFEFNTEYVKLMDSFNIYNRNIIKNRKQELIDIYKTSVSNKLHMWVENILTNLRNDFNMPVRNKLGVADGLIIVNDFITLANIIVEQIEPCIFSKEILSTVGQIIIKESAYFKNELIQFIENEIFVESKTSFNLFPAKAGGADKNNIIFVAKMICENKPRSSFEDYLIGYINSSYSIIESASSIQQSFELQRVGEVFYGLIDRLVFLLSGFILSVFLMEDGFFNEKMEFTQLIYQIDITLSDFFEDYTDVLKDDAFSKLYLRSTNGLDEFFIRDLNKRVTDLPPDRIRKIIKEALPIFKKAYSETGILYVYDLLNAKTKELMIIEVRRLKKYFPIDLVKIIINWLRGDLAEFLLKNELKVK